MLVLPFDEKADQIKQAARKSAELNKEIRKQNDRDNQTNNPFWQFHPPFKYAHAYAHTDRIAAYLS